jgi:hypothetical protein
LSPEKKARRMWLVGEPPHFSNDLPFKIMHDICPDRSFLCIFRHAPSASLDD